MMAVRFKKTIRDALENKPRTILVILAIFFGVFGSGLILNTYAIVEREMEKSYLDTEPASFSIKVAEVDEQYIAHLQSLENIESVEARSTVRARTLLDDGTWLTSYLFVIDDFEDMRIDKFFPYEASADPAFGEVLIEKESLALLDAGIDGDITTKISLNAPHELRITGSVHAPGLKPAWMEKIVYGFISCETLDYLGTPSEKEDILFIVEESLASDEQAVTELAFKTRDRLLEEGYKVERVTVAEPGKHPNGDQTNALLFLFQVFGVLSLMLSTVLVVNMISSMLSGQVRQIAVMKSTGAKRLQIAEMYYFVVVVSGAIALVMAMPSAIVVARVLVDVCASMLNFSINDYSIPWWSYALQIGAGLALPILAATYPIMKGTGITVSDALRDYGTSTSQYEPGTFDQLLGRFKGSSSFVLALRNTFRKKGRMILSIITLAVGGAMLITSLNVNASLSNTMTKAMESLDYDLQYYFSKPYPEADIGQIVDDVPGVVSSELFAGVMSTIVYGDGTENNAFQLTALKPDTETLNLPVLEGRWFRENDTDAIIVNHTFADSEADVEIGAEITLIAGDMELEVTVIGIVKEVGATEKVYISYDYYQEVFSQSGYARLVNVVTSERTPEQQKEVACLLEEEFSRTDLDVMISSSFESTREVFDNHIVLIAGFLTIASGLVIVVGCMGLVSSMSMNAMERARETGIMRSFGTRSSDLIKIIVLEGMIIAVISWIIATALSIPLSYLVGNMFGTIFLKTSLDSVLDPLGYVLWLAIVVILSALAGIGTALKTLDAPVNEVLKYE